MYKYLSKTIMMAAAVAEFFCLGCGYDNPVNNGGTPTPTHTPFTDSRDGQVYDMVTIGSQVWMAENLNYDVPDVDTDACYNNSPDSCAKYGRLYTWKTAMTACPDGWHLPKNSEWAMLADYVGGESTAAKKLKSKTGWYENYGTDDFGFSALPSGNGDSNGHFFNVGKTGMWRSATETASGNVWYWRMGYGDEDLGSAVYEKSNLFSVRCVLD